MKKNLFLIIFAAMFTCLLNSCVTEAYAETDWGGDVSLIVTYGTPYYYNGTILYYLYNDMYYYPYTYNNHVYFHRYSRPLPPPRHHHHPNTHRPHTHHSGGNMHRPPILHNDHNMHRPNPNTNHRPNMRGGNSRPNTNMPNRTFSRPNTSPNVRSNISVPRTPSRPSFSTPSTPRGGNGNFGGGRRR